MKTLLALAMMLLGISSNGRYLQTSDGQPFFMLGNTAWVMPQTLTREEVDFLLEKESAEGYNTVLMQLVDNLPAENAYGYLSGNEAYWEHIDYIISKAAEYGTYVGMACLPGTLVKNGKIDEELATQYGQFLAGRYKDRDNIFWILGGDLKGDVRPDIWNALAHSIKSVDDRHLMTFHPYGRTSSLEWWNNCDWLDFNMFHGGHRAYDQEKGDGTKSNVDLAEDNWLFAEQAWDTDPARPILDGEPAYEDLPHGKHDATQPRWQACDVRRFAYWSVFAGSCGHIYGHNSIMQLHSDEDETGAYGARIPWQDALEAPGFSQMKYLRQLMESFPYFERVPDDDIVSNNVERYDRVAATKGDDYALIYTYANNPMVLDLTRISGKNKLAFWYDVTTGETVSAGKIKGAMVTMQFAGPTGPGNDHVLILIDAKSERFPELMSLGKKNTMEEIGNKVKSLFNKKKDQ